MKRDAAEAVVEIDGARRTTVVIFGDPGSVLREMESLLVGSQRLPHFFNNSSNAERSGLGGVTISCAFALDI